ncbi:MAG: hypothetical protein ACKO4T_06720 [Planctomycetaceae bacterium]
MGCQATGEDAAGGTRLVSKGAADAIFARCAAYAVHGSVRPLDPEVLDRLAAACDGLGADGFRVLAVADRTIDRRPVAWR